MTEATFRTRLCELVGVEYPIVSTGMGYVSNADLAGAVSQAGGLGVVAAAMMTLGELETAIQSVTDRTDKPFGVNIRSDAPDLEDRARLIIEGGVKVASFALAPSRQIMETLKEAGVICIPSVGARRHAEKVAGWGADAVIVQGGEGGGHTGPVPTSLLLPAVVDAVDIPVVAAGGYFDGRGLVSALAYGACGVAMGTRFMLTQESPVPETMKREYLKYGVTDTVVTDQIDGHPHRVIRTEFIDRLLAGGALRGVVSAAENAAKFRRLAGRSWSGMAAQAAVLRKEHGYSLRQLVMAANAPMLCRAAMVDGRTDIGVMSSGQVVGLIDDIPACAELLARIMREAEDAVAQFESTGVQ